MDWLRVSTQNREDTKYTDAAADSKEFDILAAQISNPI